MRLPKKDGSIRNEMIMLSEKLFTVLNSLGIKTQF